MEAPWQYEAVLALWKRLSIMEAPWQYEAVLAL